MKWLQLNKRHIKPIYDNDFLAYRWRFIFFVKLDANNPFVMCQDRANVSASFRLTALTAATRR